MLQALGSSTFGPTPLLSYLPSHCNGRGLLESKEGYNSALEVTVGEVRLLVVMLKFSLCPICCMSAGKDMVPGMAATNE